MKTGGRSGGGGGLCECVGGGEFHLQKVYSRTHCLITDKKSRNFISGGIAANFSLVYRHCKLVFQIEAFSSDTSPS